MANNMKNGYNHSIPVPRIYKVASKIMERVKQNNGSLKSLVYEQKHVNVKTLFALLIETFKREAIIDQLIQKSELLKKQPRFNQWLAKILICELLWGQNKMTGESKPIQTIREYENELRKHLSSCDDKIKDVFTCNVIKPRYVRVNTLKVSVEEAVNNFRDEGWTLVPFLNKEDYDGFLAKLNSLEPYEFMVDIHIPDLLIFPPKTEFHGHEAYKSRSIILQDKASCLASHLLNPTPGSVVLDMCAAPGMKTTHLAASMNNSGTVYAVELCEKRIKTLNEFVEACGSNCVKVISSDALKLKDEDCPEVEFILVDPSCSGSGITVRLEIEETNLTKKGNRLEKLSGFQIKLLRYATNAFPKAKRIVYSTCSINPEENEDVVRQVLETCRNFKIVNARKMLKSWNNTSSDFFPELGEMCIYATPEKDKTNGFFVAVLERLEEGEKNPHLNVELCRMYDGLFRKRNNECKRVGPVDDNLDQRSKLGSNNQGFHDDRILKSEYGNSKEESIKSMNKKLADENTNDNISNEKMDLKNIEEHDVYQKTFDSKEKKFENQDIHEITTYDTFQEKLAKKKMKTEIPEDEENIKSVTDNQDDIGSKKEKLKGIKVKSEHQELTIKIEEEKNDDSIICNSTKKKSKKAHKTEQKNEILNDLSNTKEELKIEKVKSVGQELSTEIKEERNDESIKNNDKKKKSKNSSKTEQENIQSMDETQGDLENTKVKLKSEKVKNEHQIEEAIFDYSAICNDTKKKTKKSKKTQQENIQSVNDTQTDLDITDEKLKSKKVKSEHQELTTEIEEEKNGDSVMCKDSKKKSKKSIKTEPENIQSVNDIQNNLDNTNEKLKIKKVKSEYRGLTTEIKGEKNDDSVICKETNKKAKKSYETEQENQQSVSDLDNTKEKLKSKKLKSEHQESTTEINEEKNDDTVIYKETKKKSRKTGEENIQSQSVNETQSDLDNTKKKLKNKKLKSEHQELSTEIHKEENDDSVICQDTKKKSKKSNETEQENIQITQSDLDNTKKKSKREKSKCEYEELTTEIKYDSVICNDTKKKSKAKNIPAEGHEINQDELKIETCDDEMVKKRKKNKYCNEESKIDVSHEELKNNETVKPKKKKRKEIENEDPEHLEREKLITSVELDNSQSETNNSSFKSKKEKGKIDADNSKAEVDDVNTTNEHQIETDLSNQYEEKKKSKRKRGEESLIDNTENDSAMSINNEYAETKLKKKKNIIKDESESVSDNKEERKRKRSLKSLNKSSINDGSFEETAEPKKKKHKKRDVEQV